MQLFRNYTKIIPKDKQLLAGGSFLSHSNKIWPSNSQRNQCPHKQKREKPRDELFFHARRGFCKTNLWANANSALGCKPAIHTWSPAGTSAPAPPAAASMSRVLEPGWADSRGMWALAAGAWPPGQDRVRGPSLHSLYPPPSRLLARGSWRFVLSGTAVHQALRICNMLHL